MSDRGRASSMRRARLVAGLVLYLGGALAALVWTITIARADTALLRVQGRAAPALELAAGTYEIRELTDGSPPSAETTVFALQTRVHLPLVASGAGRAFEVEQAGIYVLDLRSAGAATSIHERQRLVLSPTLIMALAAAPLATLPGLAVLEKAGPARVRDVTLGRSHFRVATVRRRLAAVVGDLLAIAAMMIVLLLAAPLFYPIALLYPLAPAAYVWSGNARGSTIGRWLAGIRVVNSRGAPPGYGVGLLRSLGWALSWGALGGGYALAILRASGRAPHDAMAGTYVVHD